MAGSVAGRALGSISCSPLLVASGARRRGRPPDARSDTRWRRYQAPSRTRAATGSRSPHGKRSQFHTGGSGPAPGLTPPDAANAPHPTPNQATSRCKHTGARWDFRRGPTCHTAVAAPMERRGEAPPARLLARPIGQILKSLTAAEEGCETGSGYGVCREGLV